MPDRRGWTANDRPRPSGRHAIVVQPGGRVLVDVDGCLTPGELNEIRDHLAERFPHREFAVVPNL